MNRLLGILLLSGILIQGCKSNDNEPSPAPPFTLDFNLSGAQAVVFQKPKINGRTTDTEDANLFKVDKDGNITPIIDSATVVFAKAFSQGVYIEIDDEREQRRRRFHVLLNNSFKEITEELGTYKGENENGDLIFSDVSILRASTVTVDKLQTTLTSPTIQSISGNLAIITDNSIYQIFNTASNVRYNINGCNGPRMEAFVGSTKALVDDCSGNILIDLSNGNRSKADINGWNHESLRVSDGIIVLGQSISQVGNFSNSALGHVDPTGKLTVLTDNIFQPGTSFCMNCGDPNAVLFGGDKYLVVRELNKISVVDRANNNTVTSILDGFNVTKLSLNGDVIYYLAEDNLGKPIVGKYSISTAKNQVLDNQTLYEDIQTF